MLMSKKLKSTLPLNTGFKVALLWRIGLRSRAALMERLCRAKQTTRWPALSLPVVTCGSSDEHRLFLEAPNSESVMTRTTSFIRDGTHSGGKKLHIVLLEFKPHNAKKNNNNNYKSNKPAGDL